MIKKHQVKTLIDMRYTALGWAPRNSNRTGNCNATRRSLDLAT
jgi:hypothetical protein